VRVNEAVAVIVHDAVTVVVRLGDVIVIVIVVDVAVFVPMLDPVGVRVDVRMGAGVTRGCASFAHGATFAPKLGKTPETALTKGRRNGRTAQEDDRPEKDRDKEDRSEKDDRQEDDRKEEHREEDHGQEANDAQV
jgi:hypothetical protein